MEFLGKLKTAIAKKILDKEAKKIKREKTLTNFENTKLFGIIFNCENEATYEFARKLEKELTIKGKKVTALATLTGKKTPFYWIAKENFDFITKNDYNIFNIPKGEALQNFIHKNFDVLISLQLEPFFSIEYIVRMSHAKLKVGYNEANASIYDFMINTKQKQSLDEYIKQVMHYLNIINDKSHDK